MACVLLSYIHGVLSKHMYIPSTPVALNSQNSRNRCVHSHRASLFPSLPPPTLVVYVSAECALTYVYIKVCMCILYRPRWLSWCGEHFLSVSVDLWGPAEESTLFDEIPLLKVLLASLSVPLQVSGKGLCLGLHSGELGYQGLVQRDETQPISTVSS